MEKLQAGRQCVFGEGTTLGSIDPIEDSLSLR